MRLGKKRKKEKKENKTIWAEGLNFVSCDSRREVEGLEI